MALETVNAKNQNGLINTGAYDTARINEINSMYDAQKSARMAELESAYDRSRADYQSAREKIAPQYQQSANDLSTQYEKSRQAFQRQAAANGLNTGTGAQEALARSGQYQRDMGRLRTAEADAYTENQRQQDNLTAQYQSNVAQALANNDYQRAAALLDEYNNGYNRRMQEAQQLAEYGIFSGYADLYGDGTANFMETFWNAQNPDMAYGMGRITAEQYKAFTGEYPPGYTGAASGGGSSASLPYAGAAPNNNIGNLNKGSSSGGSSSSSGSGMTRGEAARAATAAQLSGQLSGNQYETIMAAIH